MTKSSTMRFIQGLVFGVALTLLAVVLVRYQIQPDTTGLTRMPAWSKAWRWIYANLGLSIPVFGILLCLFIGTLASLKSELQGKASLERIAQLDHLLDTWTSLFFGVGVIWTAIGMRSALVFALGEPEVSLSLGAYAILERMVQGGILLALSTTIVGGIGGYLLRVIKTLAVEADIKRYYDQLAHAPGKQIQTTLHAIERHLQSLVAAARG